VPWGQLNL